LDKSDSNANSNGTPIETKKIMIKKLRMKKDLHFDFFGHHRIFFNERYKINDL
jgi:hypothetical protein